MRYHIFDSFRCCCFAIWIPVKYILTALSIRTIVGGAVADWFAAVFRIGSELEP